MTKAEASLIMLTWKHFRCTACGAECVGDPGPPNYNYLYCNKCVITVQSFQEARYTLPLRIDE